MKKNITTGEKYTPAMSIVDERKAALYFEKCVKHNMSFGTPRKKAERIERTNLGYWAGYYDEETRRRVEKLFKCKHPVFGSIEKNGPPTALEAFEMGKKMGEKCLKLKGRKLK